MAPVTQAMRAARKCALKEMVLVPRSRLKVWGRSQVWSSNNAEARIAEAAKKANTPSGSHHELAEILVKDCGRVDKAEFKGRRTFEDARGDYAFAVNGLRGIILTNTLPRGPRHARYVINAELAQKLHPQERMTTEERVYWGDKPKK